MLETMRYLFDEYLTVFPPFFFFSCHRVNIICIVEERVGGGVKMNVWFCQLS